MARKWHGTKYAGVRYCEHESRKHGVKRDRYFAIRYQADGKRKEEGLGWTSQGWTGSKAALKLAELKQAARTGEGEARLSEKREKAAQAQIEADKERLTFGDYFRERYFPTVINEKHPEKAPKKNESAAKEEIHFRLWLEPVIGKTPMRKIAQVQIERIRKNLIDAGRSARTIEYVLSTFRVVWNHARNSGIVSGDSPSRAVSKPKVNNQRLRFLSVEDADRLLNHLADTGHWLHDICLLSLDCGLRAKEIFDLTWQAVNLELGTISIRDSKNKKDRSVPLTDRAKGVLRNRERGAPSSLVFRNANGEKFKAVSYSFNRIADRLGLNDGIDKTNRKDRLTFHSLRHTFASWLVMAGIDLYRVQTLLGHKTRAMTERYSHLAPDSFSGAIAALNEIHKRKRGADVIPMRQEG